MSLWSHQSWQKEFSLYREVEHKAKTRRPRKNSLFGFLCISWLDLNGGRCYLCILLSNHWGPEFFLYCRLIWDLVPPVPSADTASTAFPRSLSLPADTSSDIILARRGAGMDPNYTSEKPNCSNLVSTVQFPDQSQNTFLVSSNTAGHYRLSVSS